MKLTHAIVLFVVLACSVLHASGTVCTETVEQHRARRVSAAYEYVAKNNFLTSGPAINISTTYLTPDAVQFIYLTGGFEGPVIQEYQSLLFNGNIQLYSRYVVPGSEKFISDDILELTYIGYFRQDYYGNGSLFIEYDKLDYVETFLYVDQPCEPIQISYDFIVPDSYANLVQTEAGNIQTDTLETVGGICYATTVFACPASLPNNQGGQYASIDECVGFMGFGIVRNSRDAAGPFPYSENTTICRSLHLSLAFPFKEHCQHMGKDSGPCRDRFLPDCNRCIQPASQSYNGKNIVLPGSNTKCVAAFTNIFDEHYKCQCEDGATETSLPTSSQMACQYTTCSNDQDCAFYAQKSDKTSVACVNGKCMPRNGFSWVGTAVAKQTRKVTTCAEGADRVFTKVRYPVGTTGKRVSYCVPRGRCLRDASFVNQCHPSGCESNANYNPALMSCQPIDDLDVTIPDITSQFGERLFGCYYNGTYSAGRGYPYTV